jgi:hypothetical protein
MSLGGSMKDIITLSFNAAELCGLATALLSVGVIVWLRVKEYITDSRTRILTEINDDLERLHHNTRVSSNFSISAKHAKEFVEACATDEEIDRILDPVFDKVYKASIKGDSEVYIHGRDWYYRDNIVYKEAGKRLEGLGYSVWIEGNNLGVVIKW